MAIIAVLAAASGCTTSLTTTTEEVGGTHTASSGFPYHPLVYHLDLSILAYQLYGQSLVWPFDPYYEEMSGSSTGRAQMMAKVRNWAELKGRSQMVEQDGLAAYRGPGALGGFANNEGHDPILYDYSQIDPWHNALTNAAGKWTEYLTPRTITGRIKDVSVCYRLPGQPTASVTSSTIARQHQNVADGASDILLAFEGETGDKGEAGKPASQSLMGFVLARQKPSDGYDVHIAFRGSRSGSASRAVKQALSDRDASGNPDWITDLGYNRLTSGKGGAYVSTVGEVHRGFAQSMKATMPAIMHCLGKLAGMKQGAGPDNIFVTGHSLGGALAQQFSASILLGNRYGPDGAGPGMPSSVRGWPWQQLKLITYSAPRVGDERFAEALTVGKLQSEFFSTILRPADPDAISVTDPSILPRLDDPSRPAGFRVLHSRDPITTQKVAGGKHVGKTVYVDEARLTGSFGPPDFGAHEQRRVRDLMLAELGNPAIPPLAIRYRDMGEINPGYDKKARGSAAEFRKLSGSFKSYYAANGIWLDTEKYDRNVELRFQISQ